MLSCWSFLEKSTWHGPSTSNWEQWATASLGWKQNKKCDGKNEAWNKTVVREIRKAIAWENNIGYYKKFQSDDVTYGSVFFCDWLMPCFELLRVKTNRLMTSNTRWLRVKWYPVITSKQIKFRHSNHTDSNYYSGDTRTIFIIIQWGLLKWTKKLPFLHCSLKNPSLDNHKKIRKPIFSANSWV